MTRPVAAGLAGAIAAVFAIGFLAEPLRGAGWFWELGNALGFLALAGILFQMIPMPRGGPVRRHEVLGYWILATALAHAFWFLAGDGTVRFYLQPGAPLYMWLGLAALVLLALLSLLARMPDRMRVHRQYRGFRRTHRWLGQAVVVTAGLHVVLSGFYLPRWWQALLLMALAALCIAGRRLWARLPSPGTASPASYLAAGALAGAAFVLIRNLAP